MTSDPPHDRFLDRAFPFHFAVDAEGRFVESGPRIADFAGETLPEFRFFDLDAIDGPQRIVDFDALRRTDGQVNVVDLPFLRGVRLRGEFMVEGAVPDRVRFLGHPWLTSLDELSNLGLRLDDFPPHSGISDMLVNLQMREAVNKDLQRLTARLKERSEALEQELEVRAELEERLQQSQKMEALGRLAGGVAHDFNNVLTAISGHASLGMAAEAIEGARRHLESIKSASDRATDITGRLLAFARRKRVEIKACLVDRVLEDVEAMLSPMVEGSSRIEVERDPVAVEVLTDPGGLQQAIVNLVMNAVDASPDGSVVRLRATRERADEPRAMHGGERPAGDWIVFEVVDTGAGMTEEVQARIFEPFFTTKSLGEGTGLGLSTVWWLIERSGGAIEIHSEVGVGTTFRVHLPSVVRSADGSLVEGGGGEASGRSLLLVEDHAPTRLVTAELLGSKGWNVTQAESAEAALELVNRRLEPYDVLVADIALEEMDGRELARIMRSRQPWLKVVLITAYAQDGDLEDDVPLLRKPFDIDQLVQAIGRSTPRF